MMTEQELREAYDWLRGFLSIYAPEIVATARGRYALGVFRYPGSPLYKKSEAEITADIVEELADALVYSVRKLQLMDGLKQKPPEAPPPA